VADAGDIPELSAPMMATGAWCDQPRHRMEDRLWVWVAVG
jgi:hypothetical protein